MWTLVHQNSPGQFVGPRVQPEQVGISRSCRGCRRDALERWILKTGSEVHDATLNVVTDDPRSSSGSWVMLPRGLLSLRECCSLTVDGL